MNLQREQAAMRERQRAKARAEHLERWNDEERKRRSETTISGLRRRDKELINRALEQTA
jgi:hypothetical protein